MLKWLFLIFLFIVVVGGFFGNSGKEPDKIASGGYFKSSTNDRIFTARLLPTATASDAKEYGMNRPYTSSQFTAVYFFRPNAPMPKDAITQAGSVFAANAALDNPAIGAWDYVFMRYRTGDAELIDCTKQQNELCK